MAASADGGLVSAEMLALLGVDHLVGPRAGGRGGRGDGAAGVGGISGACGEGCGSAGPLGAATAAQQGVAAPGGASISYVSRALEAQGFGALPTMADLEAEPTAALERVCNVVSSLLEQHREDAAARAEMTEARARLASDRRLAEQRCERLQHELDAKERALGTAEGRARKAASAASEALRAARAERDEARSGAVGAQRRDAQYQNELRRREREADKLRAKVASLLEERPSTRTAGGSPYPSGNATPVLPHASPSTAPTAGSPSLSGSVGSSPAGAGARGAWAGKSGAKESADFWRMIVGTYERKQEELLLENAELRASVRSLQDELAVAMRRIEGGSERGRRTASGGADEDAGALAKASMGESADARDDATPASVDSGTDLADVSVEADESFEELAAACAAGAEQAGRAAVADEDAPAAPDSGASTDAQQ